MCGVTVTFNQVFETGDEVWRKPVKVWKMECEKLEKTGQFSLVKPFFECRSSFLANNYLLVMSGVKV